MENDLRTETEIDLPGVPLLDSLAAIRKRPAMYIGPLTENAVLTRLLKESLCPTLDSALSGECQHLIVRFPGDSSVVVEDDGPGLPITQRAADGVPLVQVYMTQLFACRDERTHKEVAKRYCNVGLAVVNALSSYVRLSILTTDGCFTQVYENGVPGPLRRQGEAPPNMGGTRLHFLPNPQYFSGVSWDMADVDRLLEQVRTDVPCLKVMRKN